MWILKVLFGVWMQIYFLLHHTEGERLSGVCSYESISLTLDCNMRELRSFPELDDKMNSSAVSIIKLNHNHLTAVPDLSAFGNLKYLDLSYNKITQLPERGFQGLRRLKTLDLSMNEGLTLSDATIHHKAFGDLLRLKVLKIKQAVAPEDGFTYAPLAILNQTLEELFMTGTKEFSSNFSLFTKLHTLSLGGEACDMETLGFPKLTALSDLPLRRLSARNCNIRRVDIPFLRSYTRTLQKLDLSCNPLRHAFGNITEGIRNSSLNTLLVDNINRVPDTPNGHCNWYDLNDTELEPLQTVPLIVWSFQANQLGAYKDLMVRRYCVNLLYLDTSLNNFNRTSFHIARAVEGQKLDESALSLFHNENLQPPALRYLGLRSLTSDYSCGQPKEEDLNCNDDSELFLNNDFEWNINQNPDIMDYTLLCDMVKPLLNLSNSCQSDPLSCFINKLKDLSKNRSASGEYAASDDAINHTISHIWNSNDQNIYNIADYFRCNQSRYLLANLTTLSLGGNQFWNDNTERESPLCSNIRMYLNNMVTFDFSGSQFGFIPCRNISGFTHLTNVTMSYCSVDGWYPDLLSSFPLKDLYLKGVTGHVTHRIQNDLNVTLLSMAPGLETLDLSEMELEWVTDNHILSHHPNLTSLYLQRNWLKSWNLSIDGNPNLTLLDLRDNFISFINESNREEIEGQYLKSQLQVFLSGNDVDCTNCTSDYITWLISSSAVADKSEMNCRGTQLPITQCAATTPQEGTESDPPPGIDEMEIAAIVVGCTVILAIVIMIVIAFNNRYVVIHQVLKITKQKRSEQGDFTVLAYASHSESFTENIAELIMAMSSHGVKLKSRQTDVLYGAPLKTSIVKLMVKCQKVVVFLSPDSIKEDLCQFEIDLLKQRDLADVIIVGVNIESAASQLDTLPQRIADIVLNNKHLTMPLGICSGNEANSQAFMLSLVDKLRPSQLSGVIDEAVGEAEL